MNYPPDQKTAKFLFEKLKRMDLEARDAFRSEAYEIIHDLADAQFYEAKDYFISGLSNPDPDYRWSCVSALATHWQEKDDRVVEKLAELAQHDPDISVRIIAIDSLGNLRINKYLSILKGLVLDTTEPQGIQSTAIQAILKIFGYPVTSLEAQTIDAIKKQYEILLAQIPDP